MTVTIRPYQNDDHAWVLAAEAALQAHEIAIHDTRIAASRLAPDSGIQAAYLAMLWQTLDENQGRMLIACDAAGRRVGLVAGHVVDEPFPTETADSTRFGYVSDIFIIPEKRGSGLAALLLDAIADHLRAADPGLNRLRVNVLAANEIARAAYEKAGFVPYEVMYERKL